MESFDEAGFLSEQCAPLVAATRADNRCISELYLDINRRAVRFYRTASPQRDDFQEILCILYFSRMVSLYEGIYLLAMRGMATEAYIMARSMVEVHFKLHYADMSHEFAAALVRSDELERLKMLRSAVRHRGKKSHQEEPELSKLIQDIESKTKGTPKINTKQIAKDLDREWEYDLMYSWLCGPVHAGPRNICSTIVKNDSGTIEELIWKPDFDGLFFQLSCSMDLMLQAMSTNSFPFLDRQSEEYKGLTSKVSEYIKNTKKPNQAMQRTSESVTERAPSSTLRASHSRL